MRKRFSKNVKALLAKARESALLAVEVYNKPAIKFKSGGYVTLMCIAWTALLQAVFYKKRISPIYREKNHYKRINGEIQYWELSTCVKKYFQDNSPIRKNIEFFIPLRNMIEHKFMPELDANIFGECESLLLNFDDLLETEFGPEYSLRESLSFSLQMFPSSEAFAKAVKASKDTKAVKKYIEDYRQNLSLDIYNTGQYSFKAFLIQVANNEHGDVLPIQFVKYDMLTDDQKRNIGRVAALVKNQFIINPECLKPGSVVEQVQAKIDEIRIGNPQISRFTMDTHTRCWKYFNVRPAPGSQEAGVTNKKYCLYDATFNNYAYTQAWVDFLVEKLKDVNFYRELYR